MRILNLILLVVLVISTQNIFATTATAFYRCGFNGEHLKTNLQDISVFCEKIADFPSRAEFSEQKNSTDKKFLAIEKRIDQTKLDLSQMILESVEEISSDIAIEEIAALVEKKVNSDLLKKINEMQKQIIDLQDKVK